MDRRDELRRADVDHRARRPAHSGGEEALDERHQGHAEEGADRLHYPGGAADEDAGAAGCGEEERQRDDPAATLSLYRSALRLRRLHPKAQYKPAARLITVPRPVEGGRIGGAPLRDVALLDWCAALIGDVATAPLAARA